jgi:hypothetical protein
LSTFVFECELGCVHADDDELFFVLLGPGTDIRKRPQPVDAGVGAKVDEHDLPMQVRSGQPWRIDPLGGAIEGGKLASLAVIRIPDVPELCGDDCHRSRSKKASPISIDLMGHLSRSCTGNEAVTALLTSAT